MPISRSKSQRKAANRTSTHVNARLVGTQRKLEEVALYAQAMEHAARDNYNQKAHLARVLAYVISANGGELVIPDEALTQIPVGARLQRYHDAEAKTMRFVTIIDADESDATPKIEVVQPNLEIVKA